MNAAEENELHVIVLDEFDAIARRRSSGKGGGNEGSTVARDSVVNQLLALMDGVASLPAPTFVIALTNRRELIDPAVLRPGRLEVQVAVGRPDDDGRTAILRIHAEKMRASGRLALGTPRGDAEDGCTFEPPDDATYARWLANVASRTSGFSGAALAALVRGAIARALDRSVEALDTDGCSVTEGDFVAAIVDLRATSLELEQFLTDDRGRRDAANAAVGKEYVLTVGEEEAEREVVSTAPPEDESLADEEPSKPSPNALTMSSLSEQLAMALQRIATLEDERSR
jgi:vesicle-fusing ATPase